jgi:hypothetical protein
MQDLRPTIAADTHPMLADLLQRCWQKDPVLRPTFAEIVDILSSTKEVCVHTMNYVRFPRYLFIFVFFLTRLIPRWFGVLCITRGIQVDLTPGGDEGVDAPVLFSVARPFHFLFVVE